MLLQLLGPSLESDIAMAPKVCCWSHRDTLLQCGGKLYKDINIIGNQQGTSERVASIEPPNIDGQKTCLESCVSLKKGVISIILFRYGQRGQWKEKAFSKFGFKSQRAMLGSCSRREEPEDDQSIFLSLRQWTLTDNKNLGKCTNSTVQYYVLLIFPLHTRVFILVILSEKWNICCSISKQRMSQSSVAAALQHEPVSPEGTWEGKNVCYLSSVQFSHSVVSTLCNPMHHSMPGLPVHHQLPEFTQIHVH